LEGKDKHVLDQHGPELATKDYLKETERKVDKNGFIVRPKFLTKPSWENNQ
jgi:hypothetical protein